ncbi:MAG: RsmE family RNA methyltransferase [Bdellovibrionia bacterium]
MKRVLAPTLPTRERPVHLAESEADHLTRVLRLRDGDVIEALDGHGHAALVTLRIKGGGPRIEFLEGAEQSVRTAGVTIPGATPVDLEMAILKGDAMEWVVEKAVELGVRKLYPAVTAHTVVQIRNKGPEAFRDRWQKIADQALKQCGRLDKMEVALPLSLEELLSTHPATLDQPRLWFDEAGKDESAYLANWLGAQDMQKLSSVKLLVGPEGGWSSQERDLLIASSRVSPIHRLGLGPWILRGETAALLSVSLTTARFRSLGLSESSDMSLDKTLTTKGS